MSEKFKKVVLITGAARGIGLATVDKFLSEGWQVAMLDIDGETLEASYGERKLAQDVMMIVCDVSKPDQVKKAVENVEAHFGRLDSLINNAGIADFLPAEQTTFETWSRIMEVNLSGPFLCTQTCAPVMLKTGGGSVVNIVSISGFRASTLACCLWHQQSWLDAFD